MEDLWQSWGQKRDSFIPTWPQKQGVSPPWIQRESHEGFTCAFSECPHVHHGRLCNFIRSRGFMFLACRHTCVMRYYESDLMCPIPCFYWVWSFCGGCCLGWMSSTSKNEQWKTCENNPPQCWRADGAHSTPAVRAHCAPDPLFQGTPRSERDNYTAAAGRSITSWFTGFMDHNLFFEVKMIPFNRKQHLWTPTKSSHVSKPLLLKIKSDNRNVNNT